MKTLLLFTILLGYCLSGFAQSSYKSLKECNNDTLQYAVVNFEQNKERYIGKPLENLLKDLEFKIMDFYPTDHLPHNPSKSYIDGIMIYADSEYVFSRKAHDHQKRFYIYIYFEGPPYKYKAEPIREMRREDSEWGPKYYDIFKDYIIEGMRVSVLE